MTPFLNTGIVLLVSTKHYDLFAAYFLCDKVHDKTLFLDH